MVVYLAPVQLRRDRRHQIGGCPGSNMTQTPLSPVPVPLDQESLSYVAIESNRRKVIKARTLFLMTASIVRRRPCLLTIV